MTTTTLELPPITEAMTAWDIVAHKYNLRTQLGERAHVSINSGDDEPERVAYIGLYVDGIGYGSPKSIYGPTWAAVINEAYTWIAGNRSVAHNATIRKMALAIIEMTDEHGKCTAQMLSRRDFSPATINDLHETACQRASEMCANAPFAVEF